MSNHDDPENLRSNPWLSTSDMLGLPVRLAHKPQRIISLVPSQTELLADLGLTDEVVGITKFCVHPQVWFRTKPRVGGTKDVKPERVAALKPDLIIANKEENVAKQIAALQSIAPVWVSDIQNLEDALEMIRGVGQITDAQAAATALGSNIRNEFQSLQQAVPLRVAYLIWRNPWMAAGGDTFIHDMLQRCGFINVFGALPRYPEVSVGELQDAQPHVVLLSSEPYPFQEKHRAEVEAALPGVRTALVDGELFSWYGSRLLKSPPYFQHLIQSLQH